LAGLVPDPPGGLVGIDDAISRALSSRRRLPVNALADSHHLADSDPDWAGGDVSRIRQLAAMVTPAFTRPALGFNAMPGFAAPRCCTGSNADRPGPEGHAVTRLVSRSARIVGTAAVRTTSASMVRRGRIVVVRRVGHRRHAGWGSP